LAYSLRKVVIPGLAALGLLVVVVTFTPLLRWWTAALAGPWQNPRGEILIVLGAESTGGDLLGRSSYWRSVYAVLLWRQGGVRRILISGAGAPGDLPVASPMKQLLVSSGVPAEVIETETESRSTRESAQQLVLRLRHVPGSKVLVTSDYHMFRAVRVFRRAGLEVLPHPIPDAGKQFTSLEERWSVFLRLLAETGKIAYYGLRGWI